KVRDALRRGHHSWDEAFDGAFVRLRPPPAGGGVPDPRWPRPPAPRARGRRGGGGGGRGGGGAAGAAVGGPPPPAPPPALLGAGPDGDVAAVAGVLACEIDEFLAYGQFLSRLVELGAEADPSGTVTAFERFVAAASRIVPWQPSWTERLRFARDGLAALYVRVGRRDDADTLYRERFDEEPGDTTVAIGAARAFLEAGDVGRALAWLERARGRAESLGREALAGTLGEKIEKLRGRVN